MTADETAGTANNNILHGKNQAENIVSRLSGNCFRPARVQRFRLASQFRVAHGNHTFSEAADPFLLQFAPRKKRAHFIAREQAQLIEHGVKFDVVSASQPTAERTPAHQWTLHGFGQVMHSHGDEMRLDWKPSIRGLHIDATADSHCFVRKPLLFSKRREMFDDTVGKNDVEASIREWQVSSISAHEREIGGDAPGIGRRVDVKDGDRWRNRQILPVVMISANVENRRPFRRLKEGEEPLPAASPKDRLHAAVYAVDR
jgi:hypothetical protein